MSREVKRDPATLSVTILGGVGPVRAKRLAKLGLVSVRDVLLFVPRRLELYQELESLDAATELIGQRVRVRGTVKNLSMYRRGWRRSVLRVRIEDESGNLDLLYFNQAWMRKRFEVGDQVACEGLLVDSKGPAIVAPRFLRESETSNEPRVVYPLTDGIGQEYLRKLCRGVCEEWASELDEPLDIALLEERGLPRLSDAVAQVHRPEDAAAFRAGRSRLALEPLLILQARLALRRARRARGRAATIAVEDAEWTAVMSLFPAPFTKGQRQVATEIARDLATRVPMRRLLQGDVGSGKTWVGAFSAALVARAGKQVALMAPTELLAEQHAIGLAPLFEALGLRAVLLTGSLEPERGREVREELASGRAQIAIGTHALFSAKTVFHDLALAVVDEQHRFGVAQRERLFDKGEDVHVLLMTATPIPRTLALTIYGDMETSLLADRPPNRAKVETRRVVDEKLEAMRGFLLERMAASERVFWIVPRIDGDKGAKAAFERWANLLEETEFEVMLVHGRLSAAERANRLERFRRGQAQMLVGTTIIEVGVDVPEATVMVVDGAEHMGLAQLHQIRGRVGRGSRASWCFLLGEDSASERMEVLAKTGDGFEIAELDLLQRGMGSLTGHRQAGVNDEGLDDPEADLALVMLARDLVRKDPELRDRYATLDLHEREPDELDSEPEC